MIRWIAVGWVVALFAMEGTVSVRAGEPRSMKAKNIRYAMHLEAADGSAQTIVVEADRRAWLAAASGSERRGVARMGRGLMWFLLSDTKGEVDQEALLFFEAEPLGDKEFDEAATAYGGRLDSLWRHVGLRLHGKPKSKKGKSIRLGRTKVRTVRYTMDVRQDGGGDPQKAQTHLFPFADHLIAVTAAGDPDVARQMLRDLTVEASDPDEKARPHHCVDVVEGLSNFFVVTPPLGYALAPVRPDEDDTDLIARWRRPKANGAPATLTLMRLRLHAGWTPEEALKTFAFRLTGTGTGEVDEVAPMEIDGAGGASMVFRRRNKDEEVTAWGWIAAWRSGPHVFALVGETTAEDAAAAVKAEAAEAVKALLTWPAR